MARKTRTRSTTTQEEPAIVLFAEPVINDNEEPTELTVIPTVEVSDDENLVGKDPNDDYNSTTKDPLDIAARAVGKSLIYSWNSFLWLLEKEWFQDILSYLCLICAFALVFLDPVPPYGRFSGVALSWLVFILTKLEEDRRRRIRDEKERVERRERRKREAEEKEEKERLEKEQQEQKQKFDRQHSGKRLDRQQQHSGKKLDRQHSSGRRKRR